MVLYPQISCYLVIIHHHSPSLTKIKTPLPGGSELQAIEVLGPDQRKLLSAFGVFKTYIYMYM